MVSRSPTDLELLRAWRSGDSNAGNRLVERHFQSVFRFFTGKLDHGAEDLVQQTFLAAVESSDRYDGSGTFRSYLLGIARYKILDHFRAKRAPDAALEELEAKSVFELSGSPSRVAARREEQRILLLALRRIPLDLQIAVELHYYEDMPTDEIAAVLGIPRGTVKTRLMRGREKLREAVAEVAGSAEVLESTLTNLQQWAVSLGDLLGEPPNSGD